jgi:pyruvate dehydrogenase E1 component alpha subunit
MRPIKVDGQDVEDVYERARGARARALRRGPVFLDVETCRMHGHYIGDPQVYRSKEDRARRASTDPIDAAARAARASRRRVRAARRRGHEVVEASVEFAKNGTDPQPEDALKNVYA